MIIAFYNKMMEILSLFDKNSLAVNVFESLDWS